MTNVQRQALHALRDKHQDLAFLVRTGKMTRAEAREELLAFARVQMLPAPTLHATRLWPPSHATFWCGLIGRGLPPIELEMAGDDMLSNFHQQAMRDAHDGLTRADTVERLVALGSPFTPDEIRDLVAAAYDRAAGPRYVPPQVERSTQPTE